MRTIALRTIAAGALAVTSSAALGADMGLPAAFAPVPVFTWTGVYLGGHGGYGSGTIGQLKPQGGFGGGQIGYNYQVGNMVAGIEADGAAASMSNTLTTTVAPFGVPLSINFKDEALATLRARVGYASGNVLIYATGGGAWAHGNLSATALNLNTSGNAWHSGAAGSAGVEWAFQRNWTAKVEYMYYGLNGATYPNFIGTVQTGDLKINTIKVGINYLFH